MDLTPENKAHIDGLSQEDLLRRWRFAPVGDPWLQGETGDYWRTVLAKLQQENPAAHTAASKAIGW